MSRIPLLPILGLLLLHLPSCLAVVAGAAIGAGAVVVTSEDTAEVSFDRDREEVWDQVYKVADDWGTVTKADRVGGFLVVEEGETRVQVKVTHPVEKTVTVAFQARKLGWTVPDRDRAQRLAETLRSRLTTS